MIMKYGIDWYKENATDGGYIDNQIINSIMRDEREINPQELEKLNFNARVSDVEVLYDKILDNYYLLVSLYPKRHGEKSVVNIIISSEVLDDEINETIELPPVIKATQGIAKFVIDLKSIEFNNMYEVSVRYKDIKEKKYNELKKICIPFEIYNENLTPYLEIKQEDFYNKYNVDRNNKCHIQYCYIDYTHGNKWDNCHRIEGVEAYQKEDGTWTSDVVANPEKYLKSDLDWYYSDERMVDYIEAKGLLPQDKIDAIRAANYEDIFSFEYKMKSAIKIIPIVLVIIIIAIIVIKKMRKRIF